MLLCAGVLEMCNICCFCCIGTMLVSDANDCSVVTSRLTLQGAIYATDNGAYSWSAAVQETVDATLNRTVSSGISGASYYEGTFSTIQRSPAGDYVAVSSRGKCPVWHQLYPVKTWAKA